MGIIKKFFMDSFTGEDNQTFDLGRLLWAVGVLALLGLTVYSVVFKGAVFSATEFGLAFAGLLMAGGGALAFKRHTEPKANPGPGIGGAATMLLVLLGAMFLSGAARAERTDDGLFYKPTAAEAKLDPLLLQSQGKEYARLMKAGNFLQAFSYSVWPSQRSYALSRLGWEALAEGPRNLDELKAIEWIFLHAQDELIQDGRESREFCVSPAQLERLIRTGLANVEQRRKRLPGSRGSR